MGARDQRLSGCLQLLAFRCEVGEALFDAFELSLAGIGIHRAISSHLVAFREYRDKGYSDR